MQDTVLVQAAADSVTGSWFGVNIASPIVIFAFFCVFGLVAYFAIKYTQKGGVVVNKPPKTGGRTKPDKDQDDGPVLPQI